MSFIKNLLFNQPLDFIDKHLIKAVHKFSGVKSADFVKAKKKTEQNTGQNYSKYDLLKHIETMEGVLERLLKKEYFPPSIDMDVTDIEYDYKGNGIERVSGHVKYREFKIDEVPLILEYFKDAGFDVKYDPDTITPLCGKRGRFVFTFHYE